MNNNLIIRSMATSSRGASSSIDPHLLKNHSHPYSQNVTSTRDAHRRVYTNSSSLPQIAIKRKDAGSPSKVNTEVSRGKL